MKRELVLWCLVGLLALTVVLGFLEIRSVQANQNTALRSIICFSEAYVQHSKTITPQQKQQTLQFYDQALAAAHLKPCP